MRLANPVKEGMAEGLIDTDAEVWVDLQHAVQKVNALSTGSRVLSSHVDALDWLKAFQVGDSLSVGHEGDVVVVRGAEHIKNDCELVIAGHREPVSLDASVTIRAKREA